MTFGGTGIGVVRDPTQVDRGDQALVPRGEGPVVD